MMWIINCFLCTALCLYIILQWSYSRLDKCLTVALFGYFCCPVFKMGSFEVNGSYLITLALFCISAQVFQRKLKLREVKFLSFQVAFIGIMIMAGCLNGVLSRAIIVPLIGYFNIAIGTFGCIYLFLRVKEPVRVLKRSIVKANACHIIFGIIQLTNASIAYKVTGQLYASEGRGGPLKTMEEIGAFMRVFGATYSPTILGGYVLLAFSFVLGCILTEKKQQKGTFALLLSIILLGFMAFSKTAILGILVIGFIFSIKVLLQNRKRCRRFIFRGGLVLLTGFGITAAIARYLGFWGQIQYYFGVILSNPFQAFVSRYGNGVLMQKPDSLVTSGMAGSVALFRKHPIIGVGMTAVLDEFVGDSQYMTLLHNGGILLCIMTMLFYLSVFWRQKKTKGQLQVMLLTALMLGGVAMDVLTTTNFIPFIAFCIGIEGVGRHESAYGHSDTRWRRGREGGCGLIGCSYEKRMAD